MSRAFVLVLDACGAGALPDAASYGDQGSNTLGHLAHEVGGLALPTLERLGLGSILPLDGVKAVGEPVLHGRLAPRGPGKDSTAGHWELMGVVMERPLPTYAEGFPAEVIALVRRASGREVICNRPYNGIEAIEDFGAEHARTGALIVYTSQDSVLQIAAHEELLSRERLYEICGKVRAELPTEHAVGRVIARPFTGAAGAFTRTPGRHDFSVRPPSRSYLEEIHDAGVPVHTVGKAGQLFDGIGVDVEHAGATNDEALRATDRLIRELDDGLVFVNLVETDQVYGHRHDALGFHGALQRIDAAVDDWLPLLDAGDLFILTADHGCDVTAPHTDHTREYAPLLAVFEGHHSRRHEGALSDVGASALRWLADRAAPSLPGDAFV